MFERPPPSVRHWLETQIERLNGQLTHSSLMLRKSQLYLTFCLTIYRGNFAPVTNYAALHDVWGNGGTASAVLILGAIWRLSVSFTPRVLYLEKYSWIP